MKHALFPIFLALGLLAAGAAGARDCQVARLEGRTVRIWHEGTWSPLAESRLPAGASKIETGAGTRVEIRCDDGVVLTVGIATEVNLEVLATGDRGTGEAVLQLIRGIVGLVAPDAGRRRFEVRTPLAIASVRSTEWLVEHDAEAGSAVFVRAGRVAVRTARQRVTLGPGEGITVPPEGPAGPVKTWGAARIARSAAALGFGWR